MAHRLTPTRIAVALGLASLASYGSALGLLVSGYAHGVNAACPRTAPAPAGFWPLALFAVATAIAAVVKRPRRRDAYGERSAADVFALAVGILVPIAFLVTLIGYEVAYGCWE